MARIRTAVSRLASCGCAAFCLALLLAWLMPTTRAQAQEVSLDDVRDSLGDDFTFVDLPHIRMFENRPERLVVNTDPNTGRFRGSLNDRIPLPPSQEHKEVSEVAIEVEVDGAVNSQTGEVGLTLKRKETLTTVHEGKERERIAASLKGNLTGKLEWHIVPPHAWGLPGFAVGERVLGFSCTGSLRLTIEGHWREGKEITPNPPPTDITASCTAVGPHREQRPPVVFVPGIAGSLLRDRKSGRSLWWEGFLHELGLNEDGATSPTGTAVDASIMLKAARIFYPVYGDLINALEMSGYVQGRDLFLSPYDWRLDNRSHLNTLDRLVNTARMQSAQKKVVLISHSMGGLVCRAYLAVNGTSKVDKLITIAPPHLGAPKAYYAVLQGYTFGFSSPVSAMKMKALAVNWPAAYQLMPWKEFIYEGGGLQAPSWTLSQSYSVFYRGASWWERDALFHKEFLPPQYVHQYEWDSRPSMGPNPPPPRPWWQLNTRLVSDAEKFRELLNAPVGVPTFGIIGYSLPTLTGYRAVPLGTDLGTASVRSPGGTPYRLDPICGTGDGTVPLWSAQALPNDTEFYVPAGHVPIIGEPVTHKIVIGILKGQVKSAQDVKGINVSQTAVKFQRDELGEDLTIDARISCPANLHFYDSAGRHTGLGDQGQIEEQIPRSTILLAEDRQFIFLYGAKGSHRVRVEGRDAGEFTLRVGIRGKGLNKEVTYPKVKIEKGTIAEGEIASPSAFVQNPPSLKVSTGGQVTLISPTTTPITQEPLSQTETTPPGQPEQATAEQKPATLPPAAPDTPKEITNSLGMHLALIPAGEFTMGSPESQGKQDADDPPHQVHITPPFYMGVHEVTVGNFTAFVEATGHRTEPGVGYNPQTQSFARSDGVNNYDWQNTGWQQTNNHPVVNVSWHDAVAFCRWLSQKEGKTYRLPTEAEWEYACRAGTTTAFHSGDPEASLQGVANVADASFKACLASFRQTDQPGYYDYTARWNDGFPFTAPVGQFQPNRFGLYDMHGNVQEWCADWYGKDAYRASPQEDPKGPESGETRVKRGGEWLDYLATSRSSFRRSEVPPEGRSHFLGFRVVCEASVSEPAKTQATETRTDQQARKDASRGQAAAQDAQAAGELRVHALMLLAKGRLAEAEQIANEAVASAPAEPQNHFILGAILSREGKYPEAEAALRKMVSLRPDDALCHIVLGDALQAQKKYAEAEAAYRNAVQCDPKCAAAHANLASSLLSQGRQEEANQSVRKALDLGFRPESLCETTSLGEGLPGTQEAAGPGPPAQDVSKSAAPQAQTTEQATAAGPALTDQERDLFVKKLSALHELGETIRTFAKQRGAYPQSLVVLLQEDLVAPDMLVFPLDPAPRVLPGGLKTSYDSAFDRHPNRLFNSPLPCDPSRLICVWDRDPFVKGRRHVLFFDGRVESVEDGRFRAMLQELDNVTQGLLQTGPEDAPPPAMPAPGAPGPAPGAPPPPAAPPG